MLNTSPLLAGAAILFWGWQTGFLVVAIILALIIEASHWTTARWDFSQTDYNRIWNLCAILFVGIAVYCFAANEGMESLNEAFGSPAKRTAALLKTTRSILVLFQWLPVIFFPLMAAQAYGTREKIDFSTFSWLLRHRLFGESKAGSFQQKPGGLNVAFVYFGICLFAASAEKNDSVAFYPGLGLLIAWALFTQRPGRYSIATWSAALLVVGIVGFGAQVGLKQVRRGFERLDSMLLSRFAGQAVDATDTRTSIGTVGKLSLSGKIVLRLQSDGHGFPDYLREASYNRFKWSSWVATPKEFGNLLPETNDTTWLLLPAKQSHRSLTIAQFLGKTHRLLALPSGVSHLHELPAFRMESNQFGAVRVQEGPGFVNYVATYDRGQTIDGAPGEDDLSIPVDEEGVLSQIASEVRLSPEVSVREALHRTASFFQQKFAYSSYLTPEHQGRASETPLSRFLLNKRSGHCEYFATATTLLLRKAGIPTRYAVGYVVPGSKGNKAVVRARHAHAWCLVYDGATGLWQDFDTTPSSWLEAETKHASIWEPVADAWSRIWFEFSKWRYGRSNFRRYLPWIIAPAVIVLMAQIILRRRSARSRRSQTEESVRSQPGLDSEFYRIERALVSRGFDRRIDEGISHWICRIGHSSPSLLDSLPEIVELHYRLRFDPAGLTESEREEFRNKVEKWLANRQAVEADDKANA